MPVYSLSKINSLSLSPLQLVPTSACYTGSTGNDQEEKGQDQLPSSIAGEMQATLENSVVLIFKTFSAGTQSSAEHDAH